MFRKIKSVVLISLDFKPAQISTAKIAFASLFGALKLSNSNSNQQLSEFIGALIRQASIEEVSHNQIGCV